MSDSWRVGQIDQHAAHVRDIIDGDLLVANLVWRGSDRERAAVAVILADIVGTLKGRPSVWDPLQRIEAWSEAIK